MTGSRRSGGLSSALRPPLATFRWAGAAWPTGATDDRFRPSAGPVPASSCATSPGLRSSGSQPLSEGAGCRPVRGPHCADGSARRRYRTRYEQQFMGRGARPLAFAGQESSDSLQSGFARCVGARGRHTNLVQNPPRGGVPNDVPGCTRVQRRSGRSARFLQRLSEPERVAGGSSMSAAGNDQSRPGLLVSPRK